MDETTTTTTTTVKSVEEEEGKEKKDVVRAAADDDNDSDSDDDDDDDDLAFANLDLTGVNFDDNDHDVNNKDDNDDPITTALLELEYNMIVNKHNHQQEENEKEKETDKLVSTLSLTTSTTTLLNEHHPNIIHLVTMIQNGRYIDALNSPSSTSWLVDEEKEDVAKVETSTVNDYIQHKLSKYIDSLDKAVEVELLGIAAFNLFLQLNYTGPVIEEEDEDGDGRTLKQINPHECFRRHLQSSMDERQQQQQTITARRSTKYHNAVLSELSIEGQWPCQVAEVPYMLLLSRCIFSYLSSCNYARRLVGIHLWNARTVVAHERLLMGSEPSDVLWDQAESSFQSCLDGVQNQQNQQKNLKNDQSKDDNYNDEDDDVYRDVLASILLEYGLACYHFDHPKKGKDLFQDAMKHSGVSVEVTGSEGKRTKYQRKATAQMIVRATSRNSTGGKNSTTYTTTAITGINTTSNSSDGAVASTLTKIEEKTDESKSHEEEENVDPAATSSTSTENDGSSTSGSNNATADLVKSQMIQHTEDSILHERIQYEDSRDNETTNLTILDQSILLALCLDVKNTNPADGLTGEEMSAYLARILQHHDDWMVYSTALLERAWLEFEGNHTKERSILQMQALADQHTNRLTLTQSTRQSVEESSPVQDRLRHVHGIVYPPRWHMLGDIANRYASLGIVTSAAEIFTEIESWDEVVECYRRAGKEKRAEEIVRERLEYMETPRMWMALGDLTNDPTHYEKAIELSRGRFAQAYVNLGQYHFDKGDLPLAKDAYRKALKLRPLVSSVWFRVGTISMQLKDWDGALQSFSEVVQQQPDEAEAWANVAAVHMQNKDPDKAYPALVESLKQNRNNWRIWVSKLWVCLDLKKYDEAIQACNMLLDLKASKSASGVPSPEEKCVRAIVGGITGNYQKAKAENDAAKLDIERRSLNRVHALLERLRTTSNDPWVFETLAYFHETVGQDKEVLNNLMQEYRSLLSVKGWEKDDPQVRKMCQVVSQICHYQRGNKSDLVKSKFLTTSVVKKVQQARADIGGIPNELNELEQLVDELAKEIQTYD